MLRSVPRPTSTTFDHAVDAAVAAAARGDDGPLDRLVDDTASSGLAAVSEREQLVALLALHDVWMAPLSTLEGREVVQTHPGAVALKGVLEGALLDRLAPRADAVGDGLGPMLDARACDAGDAAVAAVRRIAAVDLVHPVYGWLATDASWDELVDFLALEGGPDGGFDDLVALAQIGVHDGPKVVLGANYWDELGRGDLAEVHTVLHDRLVAAIAMPRVPRGEQPVGALERAALGGTLATSRRWQPELLGALGLLELQAGPRCRQVLKAFHRLGAPADAVPFYEEHATTDPRHGKEWLDGVVAPLAREHAGWGERMVTGARWRSVANARFFDEAFDVLARRGRPRGFVLAPTGTGPA